MDLLILPLAAFFCAFSCDLLFAAVILLAVHLTMELEKI